MSPTIRVLVTPLQCPAQEDVCMPTKKKSSAVAKSLSADSLLDLANRLGLADLVIGQVKAKIEGTDVDEMLDDVTDYLRRNPEVLVVTLGAVTIATGLVVWLNNRREWDGGERRNGPSASPTKRRARSQ
jgi:hypothetical protein